MKKNMIIVATMLMLGSVFANDDEFDFVVIGSDCQMLISFNVNSEDSLRLMKAEKPVLLCKRNSSAISCEVTHIEATDKSEIRIYILELDSPPFLYFQSQNGSESAFFNISENVGSYTSRVIGENFLGHKVCSASYFTYNQYIMLTGSE